MPDSIKNNLQQQQEIEERLLELKEIAWFGDNKDNDIDDLSKTHVTTPIVPSIYTYVENYIKNEQGEEIQTVPTPIILNINGNQYIINNQGDDSEEEKKYNFDLTVPGWFIENLDKAEHFVQDTTTDADLTVVPDAEEEMPASAVEEEIPDENIPTTVDIDTENIDNYDIDQLKENKAILNLEYIKLEAQRWIDFVLNLIAYINDFEPITVKTVHDGEYQIDASTDFGLIAIPDQNGNYISDENYTPTYEATSVNTIFITTETVTAPVEEDSTGNGDELVPPDETEEEDENTNNVPDNTEIKE